MQQAEANIRHFEESWPKVPDYLFASVYRTFWNITQLLKSELKKIYIEIIIKKKKGRSEGENNQAGMKPEKEMEQLIWDHLKEFNKGDNTG